MEFPFDLSRIFKGSILRISGVRMLPDGFTGDRRTALEATGKVAEVINEIGQSSAKSQNLNIPVTNANKLRNSDHTIYLLHREKEAEDRGAIRGFLKIGKKSLYLFNVDGKTIYVNTPCLLDFWIHESCQRQGWGHKLFQHMLEQENLDPCEIAYDRPSEKLLGFLKKHYNLDDKIQQLNNFVIFSGFFRDKTDLENVNRHMKITTSPNTNLFGPQFTNEDASSNVSLNRSSIQKHLNNTKIALGMQNAPLGRYAAPKPQCSVAHIIHNTQNAVAIEPSCADVDESIPSTPCEDFPDEETEPNLAEDQLDSAFSPSSHDLEPVQILRSLENPDESYESHGPMISWDIPTTPNSIETPRMPPPKEVALNKMHMGLKNISTNVNLAVTPSAKMEFDQERNEGFGLLKIGRPIKSLTCENLRAEPRALSNTRKSVDLKFYHNQLW